MNFVARFHHCHRGLTHINFNYWAEAGGRSSSGTGSEVEMRSHFNATTIGDCDSQTAHIFFLALNILQSLPDRVFCELRVASCELLRVGVTRWEFPPFLVRIKPRCIALFIILPTR